MIDEKDRLEQKVMEDAKGGIPYEAPTLNNIGQVPADVRCLPGMVDIVKEACSNGNVNTGDGGCRTGQNNTGGGFADIDDTVNSA